MISIPPWLRKGHREFTRFVSIVAGVLSIAILIFDVFLPEHLKSSLTSRAPMITLLLLSLYVLTSFEHAHPQVLLSRALDLGIKNIYRNREDGVQRTSYYHILESARQELFIVGITLKNLTEEQFRRLVERANAGCEIHLLMLSPKFRANKNPILDPVAFVEGRDLTPHFMIAIRNIRTLAKAIHNTRGRLAVRFYSTSPTISLTISDGATPRGKMHIEIVPHQISADPFRPILEISKEGREEIFTEFFDRYKALWNESKIYIQVDQSQWRDMNVNIPLDQEVSNWLSLDQNWRATLAADD